MAAARTCALTLSAVLAAACAVDHSEPPGIAPTTSDAGKPDAAQSDASKPDAAKLRLPEPVEIRFRPQIFERKFACGETYDALGAKQSRVQPVDLRFYVQDLALIDADGNRVPVQLDVRDPWQTKQVALIDFQDDQGACGGTPETNDRITGNIPPGDYRGVVFSNGVPAALNHEDPVKLPAPLQVSDLSWGWLSGFRFLVAELRNTEGMGMGMLHIGSTACAGSGGRTMCANPNRNRIELNDFDPSTDEIIVDLGELFAETDLTMLSQCHGFSVQQACPALFERLGVDMDTGRPLPEQRVYRVAQVK